ncbi:MAG TPA: hypothetical protein VFZ61_07165 [Polyangiales bacterium]
MRGVLSCFACTLSLMACSEDRRADSGPAVTETERADASQPETADARVSDAPVPDAALTASPDAQSNAPDAGDPAIDAGADAQTHSDAQARADAHSGSSGPRASLASPDLWQVLDAAADPFPDRPASVDCGPAGVVAELLSEERVLGVETGFCDYLTATQPALRAVQAGDVLKVRLWHFELAAPEPAEAHAVLQVDGLSVLDERIPIPQPGGLIVRQLRVQRDIAQGAPMHFHLHNHGANSWALVEVSAGPP